MLGDEINSDRACRGFSDLPKMCHVDPDIKQQDVSFLKFVFIYILCNAPTFLLFVAQMRSQTLSTFPHPYKHKLYIFSPFSYAIYQRITGCVATGGQTAALRIQRLCLDTIKQAESGAAGRKSTICFFNTHAEFLRSQEGRKTHTYTLTHKQVHTHLHTGQRQLGTC